MQIRKAIFALAVLVALPIFAQQQPPPPDQPPPPSFTPPQLDQMVARIALYPDPLLTQVLAAANPRASVFPQTPPAGMNAWLGLPRVSQRHLAPFLSLILLRNKFGHAFDMESLREKIKQVD